MLQSLQARFTLSHLLPILFLLILVAFSLLYMARTDAFIEPRVEQMMADAEMMGEVLRSEAYRWQDPAEAAALIKRIQPKIAAELALLDNQGTVLASSFAEEDVPIGQGNGERVIASAKNGLADWTRIATRNNALSAAPDIAVAVPIFDPQPSTAPSKVIGIIYVVQNAAAFRGRLAMVETFTLYPLVAGILLAIALAFFLARSLALPLLRLANAMDHPDFSHRMRPIAETGPSQFRTLAVRFNSMARQLFELETGRRRLLAGIVHELGRPIGAIKLASQYLELYAADDPETTRQMLSDIGDQVKQLQISLDDLVLLAKSVEGKLEVEMQVVQVTPILNKQIELLTHKATAKQMQVAHTIEPNLPPVSVDPMRFTQIISNLLDNAYKYTPTSGAISLSASIEAHKQQSALVIAICDNGPGIAPAEQANVFQLFYRSPDQSLIQQGMGIGLALSRQLAEAQGGQLELESQLGKGCTFILRFPLVSSLISPH